MILALFFFPPKSFEACYMRARGQLNCPFGSRKETEVILWLKHKKKNLVQKLDYPTRIFFTCSDVNLIKLWAFGQNLELYLLYNKK